MEVKHVRPHGLAQTFSGEVIAHVRIAQAGGYAGGAAQCCQQDGLGHAPAHTLGQGVGSTQSGAADIQCVGVVADLIAHPVIQRHCIVQVAIAGVDQPAREGQDGRMIRIHRRAGLQA